MSVEITPSQGTGEVSIPDDHAAYVEYRRTGELPKAVEETSEATDEESSEAGTAADSETADDTEQTEESETAERDDKGRFKGKQRGLDKRFHELTSKIRELEGKLATQADPGVTNPKAVQEPIAQSEPKSENFDTYEEYLDKLTDWKLDQKEQQRAAEYQQRQQQEQQRTAADAWQKREDSIRKKHSDYDDAIHALKIPQTPTVADMREFLGTSEVGPAILYHLAKNPAEAKRIAELGSHRAIGELGKIEDKLSPKTSKATQTATKAPAPPQTVSAKSSAGVKPLREVEDHAEYRMRRMKGEKP